MAAFAPLSKAKNAFASVRSLPAVSFVESFSKTKAFPLEPRSTLMVPDPENVFFKTDAASSSSLNVDPDPTNSIVPVPKASAF